MADNMWTFQIPGPDLDDDPRKAEEMENDFRSLALAMAEKHNDPDHAFDRSDIKITRHVHRSTSEIACRVCYTHACDERH